MKTALCVIGTRPEAIKMAPVIQALKHTNIKPFVLATGQHRELLQQMLTSFALEVDDNLDVMRDGQSLTALTGRLCQGLQSIYDRVRPDLVIAQGDTTTTFCAGLSAFYQQIPFAHIEAGLRSGNMQNPFPEEFNRRAASLLTTYHFAPTKWAADNLIAEGVSKNKVYITGNTVIDAVYHFTKESVSLPFNLPQDKKIVVVTAHRRENFGQPMQQNFAALSNLLRSRDDIHIVYPVHPNPNVQALAHDTFEEFDNITLCDPLDYGIFMQVLKQAYMVISDSGGLQEEASALSKPLLVLRTTTERPEAVEAGATKLVGIETADIIKTAHQVLDDQNIYNQMASAQCPYGDGTAGKQIADILVNNPLTLYL